MSKIKGKWLFNNVIKDTITGLDEDAVLEVLFTSNGTQFKSMCYSIITNDPIDVCHIYYDGVNSADNVTAVEGLIGDISNWYNEAYKTVDFGSTEQDVPDTFLSWMQENATQQANLTLTYDLTKLNFSAGTYKISVVAKAEGYKDSVASEAVEYKINGTFIRQYTGTSTSSKTFEFEVGMTWEQWIASDYPKQNWRVSNGIVQNGDSAGWSNVKYNSADVLPTELIVNGAIYNVAHQTSGGHGN